MATKKKAAPKKKAAKKKSAPSYKLNGSLFEEVVLKQINWSKVPNGTKITVKDADTERKFSGRVFKDKNGYIIICHNSYNHDYSETDLIPGYKYSVNLEKGTPKDLLEWNFTILGLELDPTYVVPKSIKVNGYLVLFKEGKIKVGCTTIDNSVVREIASLLKD